MAKVVDFSAASLFQGVRQSDPGTYSVLGLLSARQSTRWQDDRWNEECGWYSVGTGIAIAGTSFLLHEERGTSATETEAKPAFRVSDITSPNTVENYYKLIGFSEQKSLLEAKTRAQSLVEEIEKEFPPPPDGEYRRIEDIYE